MLVAKGIKMRLENKVAVVTGGANGLGKAMCELFKKEGAIVIAVDIADMSELKNEGIDCYSLNITDVPACEVFYNYVVEKYEKVDVLINNAGITRDALTKKMTDEMWDIVLDVDLKGAFNMGRLFGPIMEQNGSGSIVNISSVVGEFGNIGQANYAAAKAGLIGLTKTWAKEFSRKGAQVRVNCIAPGYTMTNILSTVPENLLEEFRNKTMLKRLGQPIEIANAALFLASEEASYITGQVLSVNGGMRL